MPLPKSVSALANFVAALSRSPRVGARDLANLPARLRGAAVAADWQTQPSAAGEPAATPNPLEAYFDGVTEGPGVWKWRHYFDAYHRHLAKFIGRGPVVAEVGIYSGGSLPMWRHYFGPDCHVHGIDIQPACRAYAGERTTIHIGDQADRGFWAAFRRAVPRVDVLIDDGGHEPEQQMVTVEEMLPHLAPGGVYVCEDVHGVHQPFAAFAGAMAAGLHAHRPAAIGADHGSEASPFQSAVHSVHLYPFAVVIERRGSSIGSLTAPRHGTNWEPFL
jgi:hypothetical protein